MGHLYHTPCPQGLEIIWEGKVEMLQESEEINSCSKTVLSGYDNAVVHINSQRLWLYTQVLHKIKAAQIPAQMRLTKEIFSNIWLPELGSAVSFLQGWGASETTHAPSMWFYICVHTGGTEWTQWVLTRSKSEYRELERKRMGRIKEKLLERKGG